MPDAVVGCGRQRAKVIGPAQGGAHHQGGPVISVQMLRWLAGLCLLALVVAVTPVAAGEPTRILRVGVYLNPPLVSVDPQGRAEGFAVDLLETIARQEGWRIDYVAAPWPELMEKLQAQQIDLITAIAHTPERARTLSFTREPIFTNWGVVYRHRDAEIRSVLDLSGRRLGMLDRDTHAQAMQQMLGQSGVAAEVVHGADYRELLNMLARKETDAAVVNRLVGRLHAHPELVATHIIFNPVEVHYASARADMLPVLRTLDVHLARLKAHGDSAYHEALRRWIDPAGERAAGLPAWFPWALFSALGLLAVMAFMSLLLRHQVRSRTRELLEKSRALEEEILEHRQSRERLNELTYSDSLTRLPNRALFLDRLHQAMEYADRHGSLIALLFINLDDFKRINDGLGHAAGDRLLQAIAQRFRRQLRKTDTLARLGGDEFAVIVTDVRHAEDAVILVRKLLDSLSESFELDDQSVRMTASIGITVYPTDDTQETDLLQDADTAMHQAKARGKNSFDFYSPELTHSVRERLVLENELRVALAEGQFELHYQPVVDIADRQVRTLEALIRWKHPERGLVPPDRFIPAAETSGLIQEIGDWVLEEACAQMRSWDRQGLAPFAVAVNLSPVQFQREGLVGRVADRLRRHGLGGERLHAEITESLLLQKHRHVDETLKALDAMGTVLAIDDFGTGYSSLNYLRHFPIHVLKIDRSFIRDMFQGRDQMALVQAIVAMAHALRLKVVAEGVETEAQMDALNAMGCDRVQGYLMARPMPATDVADWLLSRQRAQGREPRAGSG
jgi:diguanylate cyclase (GGDEF)-like protein